MKEHQRQQLWSAISPALVAIRDAAVAFDRPIAFTSGYSHNDYFVFRGYGEYELGTNCVIVTFDVQIINTEIHAWGNISHDTGYIVKDLLDVKINLDQEERLLDLAIDFSRHVQESVATILQELCR